MSIFCKLTEIISYSNNEGDKKMRMYEDKDKN